MSILKMVLSEMLLQQQPYIPDILKELKFLEPVREYRARHASTMLAFDAVVEAVEQALEKQKQLA